MDHRNGVKRQANNPLANFVKPWDDMVQDMIGERQEPPQPSAIVAASDGTIVFGNYTLTPIGLTLPDDITEDEWRGVGNIILNSFESSVSWAIGDWAEKANKLWGWSYERIAQESGKPIDTLMVYASVCRKYPTLIRNQDATFGHHRVVAKFDNRVDLVAYAVAQNWTVSQLQDFVSPPKPKAQKAKPTPLPRNPVDRYRRFSGENVKTIESIERKLDAIGQGDKLQISQMIERDIARLESLKRKIEGNE